MTRALLLLAASPVFAVLLVLSLPGLTLLAAWWAWSALAARARTDLPIRLKADEIRVALDYLNQQHRSET